MTAIIPTSTHRGVDVAIFGRKYGNLLPQRDMRMMKGYGIFGGIHIMILLLSNKNKYKLSTEGNTVSSLPADMNTRLTLFSHLFSGL